MTWIAGILVYCAVSVGGALVWCAICRAGAAAAPTHHDIDVTYGSTSTSATSNVATNVEPITRDELTGA